MGNAAAVPGGGGAPASRIIEGALNHSGWLEDEMSGGGSAAILTELNPGLQVSVTNQPVSLLLVFFFFFSSFFPRRFWITDTSIIYASLLGTVFLLGAGVPYIENVAFFVAVE